MIISKNFTPAFVAAFMLFNASCSSDSSTNNTPEDDAGAQTEDTTDTTGNGENSNTDDQSNTQTGSTAAFGPPQFNLAECGSAEITSAQATNDVTTPTTIATGQLVQGQLSEDSATLSSDIWRVNLEPGNYHLVLDSWMASRERGSHGVRVKSLGQTSNDDETLVTSGTQGFDERTYEYLEILNPTTMTLQVEPSYSYTMNYVMGIFPNGASVPSPRFTDCPPTTRASLDTTVSLTLNDMNSTEDYRWIQLNLDAGEYTLDASMQSSEAYTGYNVELLQRFGENENETVVRDSNSTTSVTSSDQFTVLDNGEIWLRAESVYDDSGTLELTVRQ